ncbi:putative E3 ubiquitin-protein ligase dtx2 [Rhizophlyctis rosea]|uniref:RING-type E3 ubiquitin transferase n=1 Tax=Rhizophlyctis rosea TaxID=64517 RepID=A0AAD5S441_9FUNG|nr:putative E3 ubiquitin-protein ligase dtx2 [Rhizophlyctis rosea]
MAQPNTTTTAMNNPNHSHAAYITNQGIGNVVSVPATNPGPSAGPSQFRGFGAAAPGPSAHPTLPPHLQQQIAGNPHLQRLAARVLGAPAPTPKIARSPEDRIVHPVLNISLLDYDEFQTILLDMTDVNARNEAHGPELFQIKLANSGFHPKQMPGIGGSGPEPPLPRVKTSLLAYLEHVLRFKGAGTKVDDVVMPDFKLLLQNLDAFQGVFKTRRDGDKLLPRGKVYRRVSRSNAGDLREALKEECAICLEALEAESVVQVEKCGHLFHKTCIDQWVKGQNTCPYCKVIVHEGAPKLGPMPEGMLAYRFLPDLGAYAILYDFERDPGVHSGTTRLAYIPFSEKYGNTILLRLIASFYYHHTFAVGTSLTTGRPNQVVWNGVHHRTQIKGPFGFPDVDWEGRVSEELDAKGILKKLGEIMRD